MNHKLILVLLLAAMTLTTAPLVTAKSSYLGTFNQHYGTADTKLDSCVVCHAGPNGGSFNPYGRAYSLSGRNFASIEDSDSDGDGFTNIDEINALTFPGNPDDYPQVEPVVTPETTVNETEQSVNLSTDNESMDNESTEELSVNETQEETTEEPDEEATTEQQSPGFEAILAIAGILSAIHLKKRR